MLHTIEIEIDDLGKIHPLEALSFKPSGHALLTLLDKPTRSSSCMRGNAKRTLKLLSTRRFADRPKTTQEEVASRIARIRNEWE
jgi:hypothetical protein